MQFTYNNTEYQLIMFTLSGSRLYGTYYDATDPDRLHPFNPEYSSDHDWRGIFVAHPDTKIGLAGSIDHIDIKADDKGNVTKEQENLIIQLNEGLGMDMPLNEDIALYEVKKFVTLALDSNPNLMDVIFADDDAVVYETEKGKKIRDSGIDIFMSSKAKFTFSGYAMSQLKRVRGVMTYPNNTINILYAALEAGDIDNDWIIANFKGLHEQKVINQYNKQLIYT